MKKVRFLLLATLVAMFASCQKEVVEQGAGDNRPTPTGDTRITIEGEGMTGPATRSSDGKVEFEGGYATGAGLYDGTKRVPVEAHPDPGYEVNYFYGGPESDPNRYDYAQNQTSAFKVDLRGEDHKFRCGFKEKKRELTVNAGTGGSVSPSGTNSYRVEKPISITATPNSGYEFAGWIITQGDATIENPGSPVTTATLHKSNSTITANFKKNVQFIAVGTGGWILTPSGEAKQVYILDWNSLAYGNGKYVAIGNDQVTTSSDGENWTTPVRPVPWGANYSWNWKKVTYVNGKFVVIGNCSSHSAQKPAVMTSIDGVNWSTPLTFGEYSSEIDKFEDIVYGNGKFVIAGRFGFTTTSVDGINWTEIKSVGNSYWWRSITYGNGKYVIADASGYTSTSTDGINWTAPQRVKDVGITDVAYGDGKFVMADQEGSMYTSTDGISWVSASTPSNWVINQIAYNGVFIAVGAKRESGNKSTSGCLISTDGVTWKELGLLPGGKYSDLIII